MNAALRKRLLELAKRRVKNDPSHDFDHLYRVLTLAEKIAKGEGADLDVVVPAALFHDIVVYKGTPRQKYEVKESAKIASDILKRINEYPKDKIAEVIYAISVCSFSKNIAPKTLEAQVVQDADLLEATGAISIMRTLASSVPMHVKSFYDSSDPFCKRRRPSDKDYSLDLFFTRLLIAHKRMHTKAARDIARRRTKFLNKFLNELRLELKESDSRNRFEQ